MTDSQERKLRHTLGAEPGRYRKSIWGFRNHYIAEVTDIKTISELDDMVACGFLKRGISSDLLTSYFATEAGCKAVGMYKTRIKIALGR